MAAQVREQPFRLRRSSSWPLLVLGRRLLVAVALACLLGSSQATMDVQASCQQRHGYFFKVKPAASGFKLVDTQGDGFKVVRSTVGKLTHAAL